MLVRDMDYSQLPSNFVAQLNKVGDFYICSQFKEEVGPSVIKIGDNYYFRFMNFFYLPQPPESLSPERVIEICDLRLEYLDKLVNFDLNRNIVATIAKYINSCFTNTSSSLKALDFGCGSGLSSELLLKDLQNLELKGIDISEKAIQLSRKQGLNAILCHAGRKLPFKEETFDAIFAIFVMHFNIDVNTLAELRRILRYPGKFVFNVYQRELDGLFQQLQDAGFSSIEVLESTPEIGGHKIVACSKLQTTLKSSK